MCKAKTAKPLAKTAKPLPASIHLFITVLHILFQVSPRLVCFNKFHGLSKKPKRWRTCWDSAHSIRPAHVKILRVIAIWPNVLQHLSKSFYYLDKPNNADNLKMLQRVHPTTLDELSTPFAPCGCMLSRMKKFSLYKNFYRFGLSHPKYHSSLLKSHER